MLLIITVIIKDVEMLITYYTPISSNYTIPKRQYLVFFTFSQVFITC